MKSLHFSQDSFIFVKRKYRTFTFIDFIVNCCEKLVANSWKFRDLKFIGKFKLFNPESLPVSYEPAHKNTNFFDPPLKIKNRYKPHEKHEIWTGSRWIIIGSESVVLPGFIQKNKGGLPHCCGAMTITSWWINLSIAKVVWVDRDETRQFAFLSFFCLPKAILERQLGWAKQFHCCFL